MRALRYTLAVLIGVAACVGEQEKPVPPLRGNAVALCDTMEHPLILQVPASGGLSLNRNPMDSAAFVSWTREHLASRPSPHNIVMVVIDSTRDSELRWIIPAVESVGGRAYEFDPRCARPKFQLSSRVLHNYPLHLTSAMSKEPITFTPSRAPRESEHPSPAEPDARR
jgi:hypothetical protein